MFKKVLVGIALIALIAAPVAMANDTNTDVKVGKLSGQGQGQGQDQQINNDSHDVNNNKVDSPRFLPNPGMAPMPMTNGFFTAPTPDSSFRSIREKIGRAHV